MDIWCIHRTKKINVFRDTLATASLQPIPGLERRWSHLSIKVLMCFARTKIGFLLYQLRSLTCKYYLTSTSNVECRGAGNEGQDVFFSGILRCTFYLCLSGWILLILKTDVRCCLSQEGFLNQNLSEVWIRHSWFVLL